MAFVPDTSATSKGRFVADSPPPVAPIAPSEPSLGDKVMKNPLIDQNPVIGAVEKFGQGATGLLSKIGSGYAGLVHLATGGGLDKAAETVRNVQDAGTYQPRTAAAGTIDQALGAVEKPFEVPGRAVEHAVNSSDSPLVQTAAPAAAEAVSDIAGLALPGKAGDARKAFEPTVPAPKGALIHAPAPVQAPPKIVEGAAKPTVGTGQTAVETGRAAGFKFTPGGVESRMPAEALEGDVPQSFATTPGDRREINLHNQAQVTKLTGEGVLGKKGATSLAPKDFDDAKVPHFQTYTDTGKVLGNGLKGSDEFVGALQARLADTTQTQLKGQIANQTQRILNAAQSGNLSGPQMVKDISWLRANGGRSVAKLVENEVEKQLGGNSQQLGKFRDARTALAQINNLQEVTKGGQVDANALARIDANNPGLLTGPLKITAQSAAASPQDFRLPSGVKPGSSPISKPTVLGAAKSVAGAIAKKVAPGRFDVTSDAFQRRFGREATPTELSYMQDFGRRPAPPSQAFELQRPPGEAAGAPAQRGMDLPQGRPAPPVLALEPAEGALGEPPGRQLGMEMAQGRPLEEQKLGLMRPEGVAHEPYQPSLLPHPERKKGKGRGKD